MAMRPRPSSAPGDIPLFFQSHDVGTAQLFYEKYGFAARVAYQLPLGLSRYARQQRRTDEYTDDNGQLDVHASYQITPQVTIFGDGTNLTDAPWRRYIGTPGQSGRARALWLHAARRRAGAFLMQADVALLGLGRSLRPQAVRDRRRAAAVATPASRPIASCC